MGKEENASPSVVKGDMVGVARARMGLGQRAGSNFWQTHARDQVVTVGCPRDQLPTQLSYGERFYLK